MALSVRKPRPKPAEPAVPKDGRGGRRPGAGRPKGARNIDVLEAENLAARAARDQHGEIDLFGDGAGVPPALEPSGGPAEPLSVRMARAKVAKEEQAARLTQLKADELEGQLVSRDAVGRGIATALATLAQGIRGIPDLLERKHALDPHLVQVIADELDDMLGTLATALGEVAEPPAPEGDEK